MQSKYRVERLGACTTCEVCRRTFETRERFERGCHKCAPIVVDRVFRKVPPPREWFDAE